MTDNIITFALFETDRVKARDVYTERKRDRATSNWRYKHQNRCNVRLP